MSSNHSTVNPSGKPTRTPQPEGILIQGIPPVEERTWGLGDDTYSPANIDNWPTLEPTRDSSNSDEGKELLQLASGTPLPPSTSPHSRALSDENPQVDEEQDEGLPDETNGEESEAPPAVEIPSCPICMLPLSNGDVIRTPCRPVSHTFCTPCMMRYLSTRKEGGRRPRNCPMCRQRFGHNFIDRLQLPRRSPPNVDSRPSPAPAVSTPPPRPQPHPRPQQLQGSEFIEHFVSDLETHLDGVGADGNTSFHYPTPMIDGWGGMASRSANYGPAVVPTMTRHRRRRAAISVEQQPPQYVGYGQRRTSGPGERTMWW